MVGSSLSSRTLYPAFPFRTFGVSVEKSADSLMGGPLCAICLFHFVAFTVLFLSLIFVSLITMCLMRSSLGLFLSGPLCFLSLVDYFLSPIKEVFSCNLFKYLLRSLLSLSFWKETYNGDTDVLNVVPELSQAVFYFFSFFFLYAVLGQNIILSSRSFIHSSALVFLLLIPSSVLFISVSS